MNTKPIKLIELFSGMGTQALALKYLGVNFEHHKTCEWSINSILAYKYLHSKDSRDYSINLTKENLVNMLFNRGISKDYKTNATKEQLNNMQVDKLREIYNAIASTNNVVDITKIHGVDLDIVDVEKYLYIMTYSYPCQDLSVAGTRLGMGKGTETRSSLLWEVERVLEELKKYSNLPQVLVMENVTQVHSKKNIEDFNIWISKLEDLGYKNYWDDYSAVDFGIPQTRKRTFMISVLNGTYTKPNAIKPKYVLKDFLDPNNDRHQYLDERLQQYFNKIKDTINIEEIQKQNPNCLIIPESTKRGYKEAYNGDGIYVNRPHQKRGCVQSGKLQTITTSSSDLGVVVKVGDKLKVRKIETHEYFRLMGVTNEDYKKMNSLSDSIKHHIAGDGIVVTVLMGVFGNLLGIDYEKKINEILEKIIYLEN